jgi:hypothetical protein
MAQTQVLQTAQVNTVTIAASAALSGAIDFRRFSRMEVHMPSAWTAADIGFQVSGAIDGTYLPLYDEADPAVLLEIGAPAVDQAHVAPAKLAGAAFVKLWSQTAGTGVNQAAERLLVVVLKS